MKKMTQQEFENLYCLNSNQSREWYDRYFVTLPCSCGDPSCHGWACVPDDAFSIATHRELYT